MNISTTLRRKRTKIVATLGPASSSPKIIEALVHSGVDVFRINSAHASCDDLATYIRKIRAASRKVGRCVGILQDLPGPKIRVGKLPEARMTLRRNDRVWLSSDRGSSRASIIPVAYPYLTRDLKRGQSVFIADGSIRLLVVKVLKSSVLCRVTTGGIITSGKGINMPQTRLSLSAFTPEDRRHLACGVRLGVDFAGISFAGSGADLRRVRRSTARERRGPLVIAKIERQEGLKNLGDILASADGLMVARGDLGVEVSFAEIPGVQQEIVRRARLAGKPVIVATQVLESMVENPRPTRAEVTDIAHAVEEGADAIMLSGETSIGKYPVEAVRTLSQVIQVTERDFSASPGENLLPASHPSEYIVREACRMAAGVKAKAIIIPSLTGRTMARVSRMRPAVPILAIVREARMLHRFSLYWGVETVRMEQRFQLAKMVPRLRKFLLTRMMVKKGDRVLVISGGLGVPVGETGMVQIVQI